MALMVAQRSALDQPQVALAARRPRPGDLLALLAALVTQGAPGERPALLVVAQAFGRLGPDAPIQLHALFVQALPRLRVLALADQADVGQRLLTVAAGAQRLQVARVVDVAVDAAQPDVVDLRARP